MGNDWTNRCWIFFLVRRTSSQTRSLEFVSTHALSGLTCQFDATVVLCTLFLCTLFLCTLFLLGSAECRFLLCTSPKLRSGLSRAHIRIAVAGAGNPPRLTTTEVHSPQLLMKNELACTFHLLIHGNMATCTSIRCRSWVSGRGSTLSHWPSESFPPTTPPTPYPIHHRTR